MCESSSPAINRNPLPGQRSIRLIVLGSTGSIGSATLEVVSHLRDLGQDIQIVALAAGSNNTLLLEQARAHQVTCVALRDSTAAAKLRQQAPELTVLDGEDAASDIVDLACQQHKATDAAAAIVGVAGLPPTLRAIQHGLDIHLSNKETLVAGGALVRQLTAKHGARLLPVDSEHAGLLQSLASRIPLDQILSGQCCDAVDLVTITASGGALRDIPLEQAKQATAAQALSHPTWNMGTKVTLDSASMVNKALEVIEAHWLFGLPAKKIHAVIHPSSVVHAMVAFTDGSWISQMSVPDMRGPIQSTLTLPKVVQGRQGTLDLLAHGALNFHPIDPERWPAFSLAYRVLEMGNNAGTLFNAANEIAVEAWRQQRIRMGQIAPLIQHVLDTAESYETNTLDAINNADQMSRQYALEYLQKID